MSVLSQPRFHDEAAASAYLESIIWADGTVCPQCGVVNGRIYDLAGVRGKPSKKNPEGALRHGLKKCGECRKQFTAKVGTVFEDAKLPLHLMLQAVHLMTSSKKGISSHQLSRLLEIQYNSAWFLSHRIREAMRSGDLTPFGSGGTPVEVDETYLASARASKRRRAVTPTSSASCRWWTAPAAPCAPSRSTSSAPMRFTRSSAPTSLAKLG